MHKDIVRAAIVLIVGVLFWQAMNTKFGSQEPWDAPEYWTISYPLALAIAAVFGLLFFERPWAWAILIIFAQFPVMVANAGVGPLLPVGLMFLAVLSIPAVVVASTMASLRRRFRRG